MKGSERLLASQEYPTSPRLVGQQGFSCSHVNLSRGRASHSSNRLSGKTPHILFPDDTPETCIYSNWSPWSACSSSTCDKGKRMRQRMLKAQLDLSVPCPDTQDFQPCMGPGCSDEGEEVPHQRG